MKSRSSVAGILDPHGGLRVVVTEEWRFRFHVGPGELLFVLPGVRVREPVPWNNVPRLWLKVERLIAEWIRSKNDPQDLNHPAVVNYLRRKEKGNKESLHVEELVK